VIQIGNCGIPLKIQRIWSLLFKLTNNISFLKTKTLQILLAWYFPAKISPAGYRIRSIRIGQICVIFTKITVLMFNLPVFMEYNKSIVKSMQIRMYGLSYPFFSRVPFRCTK